MSERCPGATAVRAHELRGWKLAFRRTADIVPAVGHTVHGALYQITASDRWLLDRFEGVHRAVYRRMTVPTGGRERALAYVMNRHHIAPPEDCYYDLINIGYLDWGLPTAALLAARNASIKTNQMVQQDQEEFLGQYRRPDDF
jgi:gamma-glutamylcyclotransferase (GGCT)/AIG2-like uncharacterized protein YtfP